jgi:rhodanese-related sulfurtransferase
VYFSEAASLAANRMYTNINTFSGGMKAWKSAGYPIVKTDPLPAYPVEAIDAAMFKKEFNNYCVVDIRIPKHYAMGLYTKYLNDEMVALSSEHRKKYIHKIPLPYLSDRYPKIPRDKKVIVVDYKGKQAPLAVRYLRHMGYTDICMLKGGLNSFEQ